MLNQMFLVMWKLGRISLIPSRGGTLRSVYLASLILNTGVKRDVRRLDRMRSMPGISLTSSLNMIAYISGIDCLSATGQYTRGRVDETYQSIRVLSRRQIHLA
jgi:hypothetical protein